MVIDCLNLDIVTWSWNQSWIGQMTSYFGGQPSQNISIKQTQETFSGVIVIPEQRRTNQ